VYFFIDTYVKNLLQWCLQKKAGVYYIMFNIVNRNSKQEVRKKIIIKILFSKSRRFQINVEVDNRKSVRKISPKKIKIFL
jgi:hypothetical protein